jgi:mono/diheme cytochrome c family protein
VARHILGALGVAAVAVVALLAFAYRPALAPIAPPAAASFPAEQVATGEMLAGAANCSNCHTAPGGPENAGGRLIWSRIGVFYSPNITPDAHTGIGTWSEAAFARALREGVSRDGHHLFPAFPYTHFSQLVDADIRALYAYFMTRPPVSAPNRPNFLSFPFEFQPLLAMWKAIYLKRGPYRPDPDHDARWNRGAYLAEAVGACADCHTDRNILGAEQAGHPYAGAQIGFWYAASLDVSPTPTRWTEDEFFAFLRHGESPPHGVAIGPMRPVITGLARLSDDDLRAMAAYFISLRRPFGMPLEPALARVLSPIPPADETKRGAALYLESCASCHGAPGQPPTVAHSPLGLNEALWNPYRPYNTALAILDGIDAHDGLPGSMPAFRDTLSDDDIDAITHYLRKSYTTHPSWGSMNDLLGAVRSVPPELR